MADPLSAPFDIGPFRSPRRRLPDLPSLTDPARYALYEQDPTLPTTRARPAGQGDPIWAPADEPERPPDPQEEYRHTLRQAAIGIHCHPNDYPSHVRLVASGCIEILMQLEDQCQTNDAHREQCEKLQAECDVLAERLMSAGLRVQELERRQRE